jgi:hypothetical protein
MAREESGHSIDTRTMSLPPSSPSKSSFAGKHKRRHHKEYSDSQSGTVRQSESVTNIKETLGERGVMLPDSPRSSRASPFDDAAVNGSISADTRPHRPDILSEDSTESTSRSVSARGKEILPHPKDEDLDTEYQDAVATPQFSPIEYTDLEDPMKTPTPVHATPIFSAQPVQSSASTESEESAVVMGGDSGLDVRSLC